MSIKDETVQGLTNVEAFVSNAIEGLLDRLEDDPEHAEDATHWQEVMDEYRETLTNARTLVSCVTAH